MLECVEAPSENRLDADRVLGVKGACGWIVVGDTWTDEWKRLHGRRRLRIEVGFVRARFLYRVWVEDGDRAAEKAYLHLELRQGKPLTRQDPCPPPHRT
jgi:hypothetical protein